MTVWNVIESKFLLTKVVYEKLFLVELHSATMHSEFK
jgi:hypothetical protein